MDFFDSKKFEGKKVYNLTWGELNKELNANPKIGLLLNYTPYAVFILLTEPGDYVRFIAWNVMLLRCKGSYPNEKDQDNKKLNVKLH